MSTNAENDIPSSDPELMRELFGDEGSEDGEASSNSSTSDSSTQTATKSNAGEVVELDECKNANMESMMGEMNLERFEMDVLPQIMSHSVNRASGPLTYPRTPSSVGFSTAASFDDHTPYEEDYMDVDDPHLYQAAWGMGAHNNINTVSQCSDSLWKRSRRSQRGFGSPFTFSWNKSRRSKVSSSPYPIPGKGQRLGRHDPRKPVLSMQGGLSQPIH